MQAYFRCKKVGISYMYVYGTYSRTLPYNILISFIFKDNTNSKVCIITKIYWRGHTILRLPYICTYYI